MEQIEFEHHVATLRQKLVRYALQYLANDDEAEDAVQESLLKLWQLRQRINDAKHIQHLALIVVRNTSISMLRKRNAAHSVSLDVPSPMLVCSDNVHRQMEIQETEKRLERCISSLPDKQKAILEMRNVEHLSYSDIAHILGTTESSVRGMISRARYTLLQKLNDRKL